MQKMGTFKRCMLVKNRDHYEQIAWQLWVSQIPGDAWLLPGIRNGYRGRKCT